MDSKNSKLIYKTINHIKYAIAKAEGSAGCPKAHDHLKRGPAIHWVRTTEPLLQIKRRRIVQKLIQAGQHPWQAARGRIDARNAREGRTAEEKSNKFHREKQEFTKEEADWTDYGSTDAGTKDAREQRVNKKIKGKEEETEISVEDENGEANQANKY